MILLSLIILVCFRIYIKSIPNIFYLIVTLFILVSNELYINKLNILV